MKVLGVDHAQLTIPPGQESAAREFYCGFLGLTEIEKPEVLRSNGGFWMKIENIMVHVGCEEGVNRQLTKAHIAYRVTDLPAWRKSLTARGIKVIDGTPIPGFERFEFRDPFGNRIEFLEELL